VVVRGFVRRGLTTSARAAVALCALARRDVDLAQNRLIFAKEEREENQPTPAFDFEPSWNSAEEKTMAVPLAGA
jgi:hypothetical protein